MQYGRSGAMFFDLFTSIPVSYLELAAEINCNGGLEEGSSSELRMLRYAFHKSPVTAQRTV